MVSFAGMALALAMRAKVGATYQFPVVPNPGQQTVVLTVPCTFGGSPVVQTECEVDTGNVSDGVVVNPTEFSEISGKLSTPAMLAGVTSKQVEQTKMVTLTVDGKPVTAILVESSSWVSDPLIGVGVLTQVSPVLIINWANGQITFTGNPTSGE